MYASDDTTVDVAVVAGGDMDECRREETQTRAHIDLADAEAGRLTVDGVREDVDEGAVEHVRIFRYPCAHRAYV